MCTLEIDLSMDKLLEEQSRNNHKINSDMNKYEIEEQNNNLITRLDNQSANNVADDEQVSIAIICLFIKILLSSIHIWNS